LTELTAQEGFNWIESHIRPGTNRNKRQDLELRRTGAPRREVGPPPGGLPRKNGFQVTTGVGGMPTAFVATWGEGKPAIGFLGEYDALPGVSQKVSPSKKKWSPGGAGHGCGHNLLGVAAMGAAIAFKEELSKRGLPGTVKYFGCPAEENFSGKAFMARDGLFDDLDACLTWHPGPMNIVRGGSSLAVNSMNVTFHGICFPRGGSASPRQERPGRRRAHECGGELPAGAHHRERQGFTT
jgi:amidohydrolase